MIPKPSTQLVVCLALLGLSCGGRDLQEAREALEEVPVNSSARLALRKPLRVASDDTVVTVVGVVSHSSLLTRAEDPDDLWIVSFERQPEGGLRYRSAEMPAQLLSPEDRRRLLEDEAFERWLLEDMRFSVPSRVPVTLPTAMVREPIPRGAALVSIDAQGQIRVSSGVELVVPVPSDEDVRSFATAWKQARDPSSGEAIVAIEADTEVPWHRVDGVVDALVVSEVDGMIFLTRNAAPRERTEGVPDLFPGGLRYTHWPPKGVGVFPVPDPTPDAPEPIWTGDEPKRQKPERPEPERKVVEDPGLGPVMVGGDVKAPVRVYDPQPQYTEIARKARIQGIIIVQATIDESGNVTDARILKGLPMGLDQQALEAVREWKFEPATLDGEPVAVYYNLTINFTLQ